MENMSISKEAFIDRLEAFMKMEKLNANSLTVSAKLSNGLVNKALKNRSSMNSDSIERILCAYPRLSADWLMTGKGTMYVEELPKITDYMSNTHNNDSLIFFLRDRHIIRDFRKFFHIHGTFTGHQPVCTETWISI